MSSHPATGLAIEFDTNDMTENYDQRDGQPEGKTHFKVNIEHPHYGGRVTVETNSPRPLRSSKRSFRTPGLHQNAIPSPVSPVEELGNNLREFHTQKKTAGDPDGPRPTMKAAQHPGLPSLPSKRSLNLGSQKKTSPSRTWAITGERERPFNDMPEGLVLDQVQTGPLEIDSEGASRNRAPRRHFISRLSLLVPLKRIFSSL
ncbi:hypothetical protein FA15DRAFT_244433 [Coprinopsis marcescibilis]|uniref:Uncharacterized protein n=1 Tax=Coprinopsis marcescibilis TaxID=230819 RepID=A0A5C3L2F2_COPMA|nr:hypothetical protein FA15DRAFT_244433 [Coprinopsis marcescibilis]